MIRKFVLGLGACAIAFLAVGCDNKTASVAPSGPTPGDMEKMRSQSMAQGGNAVGAAMDPAVLTKSVEDALPKIEEKIKGLTGDNAKSASDLLANVKKMLAELKTNPKEKIKEVGALLTTKLAELKTMVGL